MGENGRTESDEHDVITVNRITDCLLDMGPAANLFREVHKLIRLYYVLPARVVTAECSFSSKRRLKTYLHSTMTPLRLNSVMVLHINSDRANALNTNEIMREFITINDVHKDAFG